jgi:membrane-bound ClpP family serine protease
MVDCHATAMESIQPAGHVPEGRVLVEGEIWRAVSSAPIPAGATVRVVGHEHFLLRVEPEASPAQR